MPLSPSQANPHRPFLTAAVLGAGTMGSQIAAHLANAGLRVSLLDMPAPEGPDKNAVVNRYFKAATRLKPDPFFTKSVSQRIRRGNFEDDFAWVGEADWVIEAVIERLDIKQQVMARVEATVSPDAVITTNTSGIPVAEIAQACGEDFRRRLLGAHFFNPPRYLKLLELIPTEETDPDVLDRVAWFGRLHLGKGIVVANDVPYFIGNRIGMYAVMGAIEAFAQGEYSIEEIDALTGPLVGRPKSGTFRTADVVGLDVMRLVAGNLYENVPHDESRERFRPPAILDGLVKTGALGAKTKAGFYRKEGGVIRSFNPATGGYEDPKPLDLGDLKALRAAGGLEKRLRALYDDDGRAGAFFRNTTLDLLAYSARRIPEITSSPANVDRALCWGFGWRMGPFQIWDALGFGQVLKDMDARSLVLPAWVRDIAASEQASFYRPATSGTQVVAPGAGRYEAVGMHADEINLAAVCADPATTLWENEEAALLDLGEGVALYQFRSKANTLGRSVITGLIEVIDHVEISGSLRGLIIGNDGTHFSVGANLMEVVTALQGGQFGMIDAYIATFQQAIQRVRYATKPVVAAVHQRALGGGCELVMGSPYPVAAAESYLGLVELGVGLIPAGTGTMRLAALASAQSVGYDNDLQAFVRKYYEQVAMARVATSGRNAQEMGLLPLHTPIVMHADRRFHVARQEVIRLSEQGYLPPVATPIRVLGRGGKAALEMGVYQLHQGRYISDYDRFLAGRLAHVFTGGNLSAPQEVPESYLLDLEREVFLSLLGEKKTQDRIVGLLKTNKPVRN